MSPAPWECPRCHRINAPHTPTCFCQPEQAPEPQKTDNAEFLEALKRWRDFHYPQTLRDPDPDPVVSPIWLWGTGTYQPPLVIASGPATTRAQNGARLS